MNEDLYLEYDYEPDSLDEVRESIGFVLDEPEYNPLNEF